MLLQKPSPLLHKAVYGNWDVAIQEFTKKSVIARLVILYLFNGVLFCSQQFCLDHSMLLTRTRFDPS
jgi:hypothetical protein